ncbi:MAG: NAD(+) diphosphatase [Gammaproteobacteria bacterium]|nr:NAD(+) diphosphatase [Gammaproteobacteria bacterium]
MWPFDPDDFVSHPVQHENQRQDDALYFCFMRDQLLSISEGGIPRPIAADEFRWLDVETFSKSYLGAWRGQPCFALDIKGEVPPGYATSDLRGWLGRVEPGLFYLAGRARQIVDLVRTNQYCGRCGKPMDAHTTDRARHCGECGLVAYPRLSPSIIVLVRKDDEMLLARNVNWPVGMYSTLAGFVEPGESIEQTVHREVMEEVGISVTNLRYLGSQSWPFPNSLMLGFHCDYKSGEFTFLDDEIAEAKWFRYDALPNVPGATAISRWLINAFIEEKQGA